MTISYAGNFAKLLVRWKGSIWKSVWKELLAFLLFYYALRLLYRFGLDQQQQQTFEHVAIIFDNYTRNIPLTFLLGFYVSFIVKRWWDQFSLLPFPDDILCLLHSMLPSGSVPDADLKRHAIARWLVLSAALVFRDISVKVRKRFPTIAHLVTCDLMTEAEKDLYLAQSEQARWFLPLQWSQKLVEENWKAAAVPPPTLTHFYRELAATRANYRRLFCYDWVCIPLVYTQVAALATYGFFCFCIIGRQFLIPEKGFKGHEVDLYVPVFTIVQFLFFVGWFKVGQDLMRPFGTDDDDIELSYILDRHFAAAFAIAAPSFAVRPDVVEDRFWREPGAKIPHTKSSAKHDDHPPKLHAYVELKRDSDAEIQTLATLRSENRESKKRWRQF